MMTHRLAPLMSSKDHDWRTPPWFFDVVEDLMRIQYGGPFDLDAAADSENHLAPKYFTKSDDALSMAWHGRVWCNPPHGPMIAPFLAKAVESAENGAIVAMLIPARTDTRAWHQFATQAEEIRFLKGRLRFLRPSGLAGSSATFPSALLLFSDRAHGKSRNAPRVLHWDPRVERKVLL